MNKDFYEKLDELWASGEPSEIEKYLRKQLEGSEGAQCVMILNELGSFYRGVSRLRESERAFAQAIEIMEAAGQGATPQCATLRMNLAGTLRVEGCYDRAEEEFLKAKELFDRDSYEYASTLNNIGLLKASTGDYSEAERLLNEAYEWVKAHGAPARELASSLNNLAAVQMKKGELTRAEEMLDEALRIYDSMPEEDPHHAGALYTRAMVHFEKGEGEMAIPLLAESLKITERFFGKNEDYQQALELYKRCLI